jgi:hypothetical protein
MFSSPECKGMREWTRCQTCRTTMSATKHLFQLISLTWQTLTRVVFFRLYALVGMLMQFTLLVRLHTPCCAS